MPNLNTWLRQRRGASVTEKLLVLLFAVVLVGSAVMVFGPTLAAKYSFAAKLLNMEPEPVRTLADGKLVEPVRTNPVWYVIFTLGVVGFFAVFIAPMLFPRARRTRQGLILDLVERFPFLTPLIDPDQLADENLRELRGLADEVNALEKHRAGALEIAVHDYGNMASPVEQTVDASFSEMPNLDKILADAHATARGATSDRVIELGDADATDETQVQIPLSQRLKAIEGNDDIPFDAIHPSAKPQLQPDRRRAPAGIPSNDDSTTVDIGNPDELFTDPESLAAQILGKSRAAPSPADATLDATVIRDSQPLAGVDDTNAETNLVQPLDRRLVRSGPLAAADATSPDHVRGANALDATTQDYDSYDPE